MKIWLFIFGLCFMSVCLIKLNCYSLIYSSLVALMFTILFGKPFHSWKSSFQLWFRISHLIKSCRSVHNCFLSWSEENCWLKVSSHLSIPDKAIYTNNFHQSISLDHISIINLNACMFSLKGNLQKPIKIQIWMWK